ncbi:hypothetical protein Q8A73_002638 [Channa argus]|nr:hypothetical protein Q8A73_002638 [Channa argus]
MDMEVTEASSAFAKDANQQIADLQRQIYEYKGLLENATDNTRQDINKTLPCTKKMLADLQHQIKDTTEVLRRSERTRTPTERMAAYQREETTKKEKRLIGLYEHWKVQSNITHSSSSSYVAAKRAELVAKEAEYIILLEETKQKEKIEEQHKKELEIQLSELERLQAGKDVKAARARLETYDREIIQMTDIQPVETEQHLLKSLY